MAKTPKSEFHVCNFLWSGLKKFKNALLEIRSWTFWFQTREIFPKKKRQKWSPIRISPPFLHMTKAKVTGREKELAEDKDYVDRAEGAEIKLDPLVVF